MQCSFASIWSWTCFINTEQNEILTGDCDIFMIFINSHSGNHTVSIWTKCHHIYSVVVELFQFGPKSPTDPLTSQRPASCLARPKTSSRFIRARHVWERWCFSKLRRQPEVEGVNHDEEMTRMWALQSAKRCFIFRERGYKCSSYISSSDFLVARKWFSGVFFSDF